MCIDSGASTGFGPDSHGDYYSPDAVPTNGGYSYQFNNNQGWNTQTDGTPYYTVLGYGTGPGANDSVYRFVGMPAGNYKVTFLQGVGANNQGNATCNVYVGWPSTYLLPPSTSGPMRLAAQDVVTNYFYDPGLTFPTNNGYKCFTRSSVSIPATVGANGVLTATLSAYADNNYAYPAFLSAIKIEADSTAAHLAIDLAGVTDVVHVSGTVQLYAQWWYLPVGTPTWSIVSGPGTINSATGLFTAPSSLITTAPTVVQVSDGAGHIATQTLYTQGTVSSLGLIY